MTHFLLFYDYVADYLERRGALRQEAGLALLYPGIVAVVALLILVGLLAYVVPQVVEVFERSRQSLPFLTRALLWTSSTLADNAAVLGAGLLALGIGLRIAYSREAVRARWHAVLLGSPVFGSLVRGADSARLASTLGILIESSAAGEKIPGYDWTKK